MRREHKEASITELQSMIRGYLDEVERNTDMLASSEKNSELRKMYAKHRRQANKDLGDAQRVLAKKLDTKRKRK